MFPVLELGVRVWMCRLDSPGCIEPNYIVRAFHLPSGYFAP